MLNIFLPVVTTVVVIVAIAVVVAHHVLPFLAINIRDSGNSNNNNNIPRKSGEKTRKDIVFRIFHSKKERKKKRFASMHIRIKAKNKISNRRISRRTLTDNSILP